MNEEVIRRRIRELLATGGIDGSSVRDEEIYAGAISVASALFGPKSPQIQVLENHKVNWHGIAAQAFLKTAATSAAIRLVPPRLPTTSHASRGSSGVRSRPVCCR